MRFALLNNERIEATKGVIKYLDIFLKFLLLRGIYLWGNFPIMMPLYLYKIM